MCVYLKKLDVYILFIYIFNNYLFIYGVYELFEFGYSGGRYCGEIELI